MTVMLVLAAGLCGCGGNAKPSRSTLDASHGDAKTAGGVGAICSLLTDAGLNLGFINLSALECQSAICLETINLIGSVGVTGSALCSATCNENSDCTGVVADANDPSDPRCRTGFACVVLFVKGRLCCTKFCVCTDHLGTAGQEMPFSCRGDAGANCAQPES